MPQGCWLASCREDRYRDELDSVRVSLSIRANFGWVKIPNYQLHDSHTQSTITATMPFQKTNVSMINPNIMNSQPSPSCVNMNDVTINSTKHQKGTLNLTKQLQIITYPSTLQSARKIPTHNAYPSTTVQPAHSIFITSNLRLGGCVYAFYWPSSLKRENSRLDCPRVAKPHPHLTQCFTCDCQRDQEHSFRWLQGIAAVLGSSFHDSIRTFGSLFSSLGSFIDLGSESQHHHLIAPRYRRSYPSLAVRGCHPETGCCGHHA